MGDYAALIGVLLFGGRTPETHHYKNGALAPARVRLPADSGTTVYRVFTMSKDTFQDYAVGATFFWRAFTSTLPCESVATQVASCAGYVSPRNVTVMFEFQLSAQGGHRTTYDISSYSSYPEVLLAPYTKFRIKDIVAPAPGGGQGAVMHRITLEVLGG